MQERNETIYTEEAKERALKLWSEYLGEVKEDWAEQQLIALDQLVETILDHGDRLILVDLPIPSWRYPHSWHFHDYQSIKQVRFLKYIEHPQVDYLSLQKLDDSFDFYDSSHPKPQTAKKWAQKLAKNLKTKETYFQNT